MDSTNKPTSHRTPRDHRRTGFAQGLAIGVILGALGKHAYSVLPFGCGHLKVEKLDWQAQPVPTTLQLVQPVDGKSPAE